MAVADSYPSSEPPKPQEVSIPNLSLESTVQELSLHQTQIEASCLVKELVHIFDTLPLLPGIVVMDHGSFLGMVSRQRFLTELSRPYALDLFLKRPLKIMCRFVFSEFLVFPGTHLIVDAVNQALQRSPEQLYEPVLVKISAQDYRVLDIHQLLVAHAKIHELAKQMIRDQIQIQMLQNEKMASLGRILANVAHEILNPVNFIAGNLNYLTNYTHDLLHLLSVYATEYPQPNPHIAQIKSEIEFEFLSHDMPQIIDSMKMGSDRLKTIASSLRNFSHMDESVKKPTDLHQCLDNTLLILNHRIKAGIEVQKHYGDLPLVQCFSGQMGQVFMNIISNAIDALSDRMEAQRSPATQSQRSPSLPEPWQPQITISSAVQTEPPSPVDEASPTPWVVIRIADNGPGIPAAIRHHIFEDFFTTKPVGQGTGLGLAITRQIITERHHGKLQFTSEEGIGTEFEIFLPLE